MASIPPRRNNSCLHILRRIGIVLLWIIRFWLIFATLAMIAVQNYLILIIILILLAVSFALIQSQLLNLSLFLNRSLVYSLLSLSLAIIYFGGVLFWGYIRTSGGYTGPADIGAVIFTLIIVYLFHPLRNRLQTVIDRRFYRRAYDAARVISAFTATLREEIDLNQLNERLLSVIAETLLPATVKLWLSKPRPHPNSSTLCLISWQPPAVPAVEVARDDALLVMILKQGDLIELDHLTVDSPLRQALHKAGFSLVVPLISRGELVGLLNLGPRLSGQRYSLVDQEVLTTLASQLAPALRVAQMVRDQQAQVREHERIEQELRTAQIIQRSLLPEQLPNLSGWRVTAHYQPAREVGGDLYDFHLLDDGRLGLVIGDAADKGVPAAMMMASTRSMLRTAAQATDALGEVLARVNDLLSADTPSNMFVTCFYAVLDPITGLLRYANAGHDLPFCHSNEQARELYATGMPLGLMPAMQYEEHEMILDLNECILFYSDGLVEAHNPARELFGFPRLKNLLTRHTDNASLTDFLLSELNKFTGPDWEQEDDITLVTLQRILPVSPINKQQVQPELLQAWSITSIPGNEREVMERVAQIVQPLLLAPDQLDKLKTAVAEGTMNAMEHGNHYQPDKEVDIMVLASETVVIVRIGDQGEGPPIPEELEVPNIEAKMAGIQNPRGWGLFLLKNLVDEFSITREAGRCVVELRMYRISSE